MSRREVAKSRTVRCILRVSEPLLFSIGKADTVPDRQEIQVAMDLPAKTDRNFLTVNARDGVEVMTGLSSPVRIGILSLLHQRGPLNVNEISDALKLPQSTVATNIQVLESCDLIRTETAKATKGQQKICAARYNEIILRFDDYDVKSQTNVVDLSMPLGPLHELQRVAALRTLLERGDHRPPRRAGFLPRSGPHEGRADLVRARPRRIQIPEQRQGSAKQEIEALEFSMELSSEVPGTNANWPSDISVWINDVLVSTWTSPGDFGDKRGIYTPRWWKLEGSQYGHLKTWKITDRGSYLDGKKVSAVTLDRLHLEEHHSIRLRIGVDEHAKHPGGINIFGRGFGNYDQDILLRLYLKDHAKRPRDAKQQQTTRTPLLP